MFDTDSDPKIIDRLKGFPPYGPDKEPESPVIPEEDINKETEVPQEDIKEEEQIVEPKEEVKPEVSEEEALENSKNPERTKEYIEKLKTQNKELKTYNESVLDSLASKAIDTPQWPQAPTTNTVPTPEQYPGLTQQQINEAFKGVMDDQGYVDGGLLDSTLLGLVKENTELKKEVVQTRQETKKTNQRLDDFERKDVMRTLHDKFPRLNPVNVDETLPVERKFSPGLWEYLRKGMVTEWMNETMSGKPVDPNDKRAEAERLERITQKGMEYLNAGVLNAEGEVDVNLINMKKADKEKVSQADNAKRNINATSASHTEQRNTYSNHEALVQANRLGKPGALAERLRQAGQ